MSHELLAAALGYAELGWPVFPCAAGDKVPLTAHGFKNASTDPERITAWWTRSPRANVAVATGAPGPDVLDVDVKDGRAGMELFDRARRAGLLSAAVAIIRTPSGGLHVWFEGTGQSGGAVGAKKALEFKACGGYVLLPPSYVEDGRYGYAGRYELVERRDWGGPLNWPAVRRLLDPPPVINRSRPTGRGGDHRHLVEWLAQRPAGDRNRPLFWAACRAIEDGAGTDVLDELLDASIRSGHDAAMARRTLESAQRRVGVSR